MNRDAIDGKTDGIKISANETAMLVCDGDKWMRVGGSPGASAPVVAAGFSRLMINFSNQESFGDNPTGSALIYPVLKETFPKCDSVSKSTNTLSLHDSSTGVLADVEYQLHARGTKVSEIEMRSVNFTLKESNFAQYLQAKIEVLSESATVKSPYFTLNNLPAGTYSVMINGGYPGYKIYGVRLVIAEETPITPTSNDIIYTDALPSPVGSYIKSDLVRVLGDTGRTVEHNRVYLTNQQVGNGLAHTTFTVGEKQNVRFYWVQGFRSNADHAILHAFYLVKTA